MTDRPRFPAPAGFRVEVTAAPREEPRAPVRIVHPDPPLIVTLVPTKPVPRGWYELELRFGPEGTIDCVAEFVHANGRVIWLRLPMLGRNELLVHLRLESSLERVTLTISGSGRIAQPHVFRFARVGWVRQAAAVGSRARDIYRREGLGVVFSATSYLSRLVRRDSIALPRGSAVENPAEAPYETWIRVFDERPEVDRLRHEERLALLANRPLISILAELTAPDPLTLDRLTRSVAEQIYPSWELVVAAPAHLHEVIKKELGARGVDLAKLQIADARANTAENLNRLLAIANGEYVLPLSAKALMRSHALLEFALTVEKLSSSAELIYSDEDHIDDDQGRGEWVFKPAWSPHLLRSCDYIGPHCVMRRQTVRALDGWNVSRSDPHHDLALRLTARVKPEGIVHIAKLLFHRVAKRSHVNQQTLVRPNTRADSLRVSLIIPTRDNPDMLTACIESICKRTRYVNYEIIIVDNGSVDNKTVALLNKLASEPSIRVLRQPGAFNFSALNNETVRQTDADVVGFINDDIEVLGEDWLGQMVSLAQEESVGCVGAKLVYPDRRVQHGGIVLGLYGIAGHAHRFASDDDAGYLGGLTTVHEVSAVTAACLLVRRKVFDQVGGFDEQLAVAFNDVDFCLRVRAAGYLNVWTHFAELIHHESVSRGRDLSPAKSRRFADEYATMRQRWGRELLNDPYYSPHLTRDREDFSLRQR